MLLDFSVVVDRSGVLAEDQNSSVRRIVAFAKVLDLFNPSENEDLVFVYLLAAGSIDFEAFALQKPPKVFATSTLIQTFWTMSSLSMVLVTSFLELTPKKT